MYPLSEFGFYFDYWTSAKSGLLWWVPDRVKRKCVSCGYLRFSLRTSWQKTQYTLAFAQRLHRRYSVEARFSIQNWIEKNSKLDRELWALYSNPNKGYLIFESEQIRRLRSHLERYYYIQSLQAVEPLNATRERLVQSNLPSLVAHIQNIALESFWLSVLAVLQVSNSPGNNVPGVDNVCFKTLSALKAEFRRRQLKGSRYASSGKSIKVKKFRPKKSEVDLEVLAQLNCELSSSILRLRMQLLRLCNVRLLCRKGYKPSSILRVWVPNKYTGEFCPVGVPTLRDRVLQQMFYWVILPITECQVNPFSFSVRSQCREASKAVAFIYAKLVTSEGVQVGTNAVPKKVSFTYFSEFKGKKARFVRSSVRLTRQLSKRRRVYRYDYWIYPRLFIKRRVGLKYYYKYLNVRVVSCFEKISHASVCYAVPLTDKYLHFIKGWLTSTVIGSVEKGGPLLTFKPLSGISSSSLLGSLLRSAVLEKVHASIQDRIAFSQKRDCQKELPYSKIKQAVLCVRYSDSFFLFGKCTLRYMQFVQSCVTEVLATSGLYIRSSEKFQGKIFQPGTNFCYLGFRFVYPNPKLAKFATSKYTRVQYTPTGVHYQGDWRLRGNVYILVDQHCMRWIKYRIKGQLCAKNGFLPVVSMLHKVNAILYGFLKYFKITQTIAMQVNCLTNLVHRLFYKYLLRKFSSTPKIYSFLQKNFIRGGRFQVNGIALIRASYVKLPLVERDRRL